MNKFPIQLSDGGYENQKSFANKQDDTIFKNME